MTTSRRDFIAATGLAALAAAIGKPAFSGVFAQQAQAQPVFTPIRRNVGYFTMRGGTVGYLVNPGAVAVVDTQFPDTAAVLLKGLQERSGKTAVDLVVNTHHHGDHTGGNPVFRGVAKRLVTHARAGEHMAQPQGAQPQADPYLPDLTFTGTWSADLGDERLIARHYGRAHTNGDIVVTFERANVAHMGDLMFNQRHPVVDRAAGASLRNWMQVLSRTPNDHSPDTVYIFGHGNTGQPVVGNASDLKRFHDYIGALLAFVETQVKAGKSREGILAMRDPLKGFESFGRFGAANARDPLTCAYEEITSGS